MNLKKEIVGACPICSRDMINGPSIDEHHFIPKCKKGKEKQFLHKTCHRFIHALFTEKELANIYNTPEALLEVEDIQNYVKWLAKKDPEFIDKIKTSNRKKR
jgi:hypothetical protein